MIKKNRKTLIITTIVTLLPILAGLILWNRLPAEIATHFNVSGKADGWSSKEFTVFGMPFILLVCQWISVAATKADPKNEGISEKIITLILWIIPSVSVILFFCLYTTALNYPINITKIIMIFCGLIYIIIGNYMPKMKQSYTLGIKLPWTLHSEENWNRTHRLGGWLFVFGGVATMAIAFTHQPLLFLAVMIIIIIVPTIYSYILYKKGI